MAERGSIVGRLRGNAAAGYLLAAATAVIGTLTRLALAGLLKTSFPYLTFFPLVILTTVVAGRGPGIAAATLALLATWAFVLPPYLGFAPDGSTAVALFAFAGVFAVTIGTIDGLVGVLDNLRTERDRGRALVAERDYAARAAIDSRAELAAIVDQAAVGIGREDLGGRLTLVNDGLCVILGRSRRDLLGSDLIALTHPDDVAASRAAARALLATGVSYTLEKRYLRPGGAVVWVRVHVSLTRDEGGAPRSFVAVAVDIGDIVHARALEARLAATLQGEVAAAVAAERAAAARLLTSEDALRQAQKMEAVGQLTGGIAHDFNNFLTVIAGNLDLARRALDGDMGEGSWRARRLLDNATKGTDRAATLTRRLLAFARRQPLDAQPTDPAALIADLRDLLERAAGGGIDVALTGPRTVAPVVVDRNQLEGALLNLVVNARDAMHGGGRIEVSVANHIVGADDAVRHDVAAGDYVAIAVRDRGAGLDPDTAARVFEPFFTTKAAGQGTGLGLAMVYNFVRGAGGFATFASVVGEGTTVTLLLPRYDGTLPVRFAETPGRDAAGGRETILLVEDDADVRSYAAEILRGLGYAVVEADCGETALDAVAALPPGSLPAQRRRDARHGRTGIGERGARPRPRPPHPVHDRLRAGRRAGRRGATQAVRRARPRCQSAGGARRLTRAAACPGAATRAIGPSSSTWLFRCKVGPGRPGRRCRCFCLDRYRRPDRADRTCRPCPRLRSRARPAQWLESRADAAGDGRGPCHRAAGHRQMCRDQPRAVRGPRRRRSDRERVQPRGVVAGHRPPADAARRLDALGDARRAHPARRAGRRQEEHPRRHRRPCPERGRGDHRGARGRAR